MAGMKITIALKGFDEFQRMLKTLEKGVQKAVQNSLQKTLETWVVEAQARTPVDTGALQASGRLLKPRGKSVIRFTIAFGGVSRKGKFVDYAVEVHETHPTNRKFLESVVRERQPEFMAAVEEGMNQLFKDAGAS